MCDRGYILQNACREQRNRINRSFLDGSLCEMCKIRTAPQNISCEIMTNMWPDILMLRCFRTALVWRLLHVFHNFIVEIVWMRMRFHLAEEEKKMWAQNFKWFLKCVHIHTFVYICIFAHLINTNITRFDGDDDDGLVRVLKGEYARPQ